MLAHSGAYDKFFASVLRRLDASLGWTISFAARETFSRFDMRDYALGMLGGIPRSSISVQCTVLT